MHHGGTTHVRVQQAAPGPSTRTGTADVLLKHVQAQIGAHAAGGRRPHILITLYHAEAAEVWSHLKASMDTMHNRMYLCMISISHHIACYVPGPAGIHRHACQLAASAMCRTHRPGSHLLGQALLGLPALPSSQGQQSPHQMHKPI